MSGMAVISAWRVLSQSFGAKSASFRGCRMGHLRPISNTPAQTPISLRETESEFGIDRKHWIIYVNPPEASVTRDELINMYVQMLASVLGSEEEARMKMYSVSTRFYYAFSALMSAETSSKFKDFPNVVQVLPDSYLNCSKKDYGGEPFINGKPVPYDIKYHRTFYTHLKHLQGIGIDLDESANEIPECDVYISDTDAYIAAEIQENAALFSAEIHHPDAAVTAEIPHPDAVVTTAEIPQPHAADNWYSPGALLSKVQAWRKHCI